MKIYVPTLPEAGRLFPLDGREEWIQNLIQERLSDFAQKDCPLEGHVQLLRTNQNVSLSGQVELTLYPSCDRCASRFELFLKLKLHRYLVPYFPKPESMPSGGGKVSEEEIQLQEEDLDFSTYHNDEIELGELLVEEILLALPLRFLCASSCKGLCPRCGTNLNDKPCHCEENPPDNPFHVLKGMKLS